MEIEIKKKYSRSEFFWGFFSSLLIAFAIVWFQISKSNKNHPQDVLSFADKAVGFSFGLLPFLIIYFAVGVIMLFNKKSESFAKELLLRIDYPSLHNFGWNRNNSSFNFIAYHFTCLSLAFRSRNLVRALNPKSAIRNLKS